MAHPHGRPRPAHSLHKGKRPLHGASRHPLVFLRGLVLHIIEEQIGAAQDGLILPQARPRGVQAGVDPGLAEPCQALRQELRLEQRLPAGKGHPAAGAVEVGPEAQQPADQSLRLHRLATLRRLSIRIVAVEAPEGTALKKYHAAHAGTVHQAHAFHGMDISGQKGSLLF